MRIVLPIRSWFVLMSLAAAASLFPTLAFSRQLTIQPTDKDQLPATLGKGQPLALTPELEKNLREAMAELRNLGKLDNISAKLDKLVGLDERLKQLQLDNQQLVQRLGELERTGRPTSTTDTKLDSLIEQIAGRQRWSPGGRLGPPASIQHIPQGEDLPETKVMAISSLDAMGRGNAAQVKKLGLSAAQASLPSTIVFQRIDAELESGRVIGNGVVIAEGKVLTAKHVAEQVQIEHVKNNLALYSYSSNGAFSPVEYVAAEPYSQWADPDLAVITVKSVAQIPAVRIMREPSLLVPGRGVFFIGAWEISAQPNVGNGIVTTLTRPRFVAEQLRLTVQGTSIGAFAGQSGSPIFDAETGELCGIFVAGWKWFSPAGETVYNVPKRDRWEQFPDWSWMVPIHQYSGWIESQIKGVKP